MRLAAWLGLAAALALAGAAVWVRVAPSDPGVWHVDPDLVTERGRYNSFLLRDGGDAPALRLAAPPEAVAARLDAVILDTPRTVRLAGDAAFGTYVTRSALWGFPDYASVRVKPDGAGSVVTIYSRARFGQSDMGVNRARVEEWMSRISG
jgi:hypothetical protein